MDQTTDIVYEHSLEIIDQYKSSSWQFWFFEISVYFRRAFNFLDSIFKRRLVTVLILAQFW